MPTGAAPRGVGTTGAHGHVHRSTQLEDMLACDPDHDPDWGEGADQYDGVPGKAPGLSMLGMMLLLSGPPAPAPTQAGQGDELSP